MIPNKARRLETALLVVGVAALGYNLRGATSSLPPLFPELTRSLRLSAAEVSVLASVPVLCFGVVSGFAAWARNSCWASARSLLVLVYLKKNEAYAQVAAGFGVGAATA